MANIITLLRIALAISMVFVEPLKLLFFIIYTLCGITDVLDGYIARKTNTTSKLGATLDGFADFVLLVTLFYVLFPILDFKPYIAIWILAIFALKISSTIILFLRFKVHGTIHSYPNKITGFALFLFPFAITCFDIEICSIAICVIASISAIDELLICCINSTYNENAKYFRAKKN